MTKQEQMTSYKRQLKELEDREAQARYSVELGLKTKEYHHLKKSADFLVTILESRQELLLEMATIQEKIDDESREDL